MNSDGQKQSWLFVFIFLLSLGGVITFVERGPRFPVVQASRLVDQDETVLSGQAHVPEQDEEDLTSALRLGCENDEVLSCSELRERSQSSEDRNQAEWKLWEMCQKDEHTEATDRTYDSHLACVKLGLEPSQ